MGGVLDLSKYGNTSKSMTGSRENQDQKLTFKVDDLKIPCFRGVGFRCFGAVRYEY